MKFRNVVNDGGTNPPRLRMQQSVWGMTHLPRGGQEWSLAEKIDRCKAAGFGAIESFCETDAKADEIAPLVHERGLPIGMLVPAANVDALLPAIVRAHRIRADYIGVHVHGSLRAAPEIADSLGEMYEVANDAGMPLFIETHRGQVTQDLRRTVKVLRRFKKIRFIGDFSHYVVAGELKGPWDADVWDHFEQIAAKCSAWHGRIGFGEQVQNDIGEGSGEMALQFKKLWTIGMTAWLEKAEPGDVLPFTCELGPAMYALVDAAGQEMSDRWEQSLVIRRLAEEAWSDAQAKVAAAREAEEASEAVEETAPVPVQ